MKLKLYIILLLSVISCKEKYSEKEYNLKGNVKSLYVRSYDNIIENGENKVVHIKYGNEDIKTSFNKNGNVIYQSYPEGYDSIVPTFNSNNQLIEMKRFSFDKLENITKINYKGKKVIEELTFNNNNKLIGKSIFKNNNLDLPILIEYFDESKEKIWIINNEYNKDQISKSTFKDLIQNERYVTEYKWNSNRELEETVDTHNGEKEVKKYVYQLDNKKNWIKREIFDEKGVLKKTNFRKIVYYNFFDNLFFKSSSKNAQLKGVWTEINGNDWIDFKANNKFEYGYKDDIEFQGDYEFNKSDSLLSLNSIDNGKKYKIQIKGNKLIFKLLNGEIEKEFTKKQLQIITRVSLRAEHEQ